MIVDKLKKELRRYASVKRRESNERFFKTGKGEYGENDEFIGVSVPDTRKVAKNFLEVDFAVLRYLLNSKIHEERLLALIILVEQNKQVVKNKDRILQKRIVNFYWRHKNRVNNWDLVDLSAHYILGQAILHGLQDKKILDKLVQSKILWDRRIAIIATFAFIRNGKIVETLRLSKKLLNDKEDLMHKAVGWMLREAWKLGEKESKNRKVSQKKVEEFLIKNYNKLPRTTLRYAIERMAEKKRKRFLVGDFK